MADDKQPDPDDEAWAKASPRLKGLFREALDEYFAEGGEGGENGGKNGDIDKGDDGEDTETDDDERGKPPAGAGKRPGRLAAASASVGRTADAAPKAKRPARPSGGSIVDVLIGH